LLKTWLPPDRTLRICASARSQQPNEPPMMPIALKKISPELPRTIESRRKAVNRKTRGFVRAYSETYSALHPKGPLC
jgi:hypothetical protein